jgi:glycosyltransferase involved in cell wall biosynthesis
MRDSLTFVMLSTTDFDAPQYGSRQNIACELGKRGHRVLFVEVPRALHSLLSDRAGTRRSLTRMGQAREVSQGVWAFTPWPVLPVYYQPLSNAISQRLLGLYVRAALRRLGWRVDVLWTYWTISEPLVGRLGERVSVYHCVDDVVLGGYPLVSPRTMRRQEERECRRVDLVLGRTEEMVAARRPWNPHTVFLPGGVDTVAFDPCRPASTPLELAGIPRPRVGSVGTWDDRVDSELVEACARRLPDVQFVFIGPIKRHRLAGESLPLLPNLHCLPACDHAAVPAYVAGLDVCLIPYRLNAYTRTLAPIKLYEYLAMGKPVVATPLPYVLREKAIVRIAEGGEAFAQAISAALARSPTVAERATYREAALANSWSAQVDEIERLLEPLLSSRPRRVT